MDFSTEQLTEMGLSEDQLPKVQEIVNSNEATLKQGWDNKANENAENILTGVSTSLATKYGLTEQRQHGEKLADYIGRVSPMVIESALAKEKQGITAKMAELDEKIKGGNNEALQGEYDALKGKYNTLQEKEAKFADYEDNDYKGKWEKATQDLSSQTREIAFAGVKPRFPDTVNEYESKGRWNEFIAKTEETYNIEKGEGNEYVGVDKENPHKVVKLSDLVAKDDQLQTLAKGRQQGGLGSQAAAGTQTVEEIPFAVSKEMSGGDVQTKINEHLATKGLDKNGKAHADEFGKIWAAWSKFKKQ